MTDLKNNYCFNTMKKTSEMYEKLISSHEDKKESIIETYGWDSPEMNKWYEKYDEIKKNFPFTGGQCKAYRAWQSGVRYGDEIITLDEFLWDDEVNDFIQTLKEAGIKEFAYTNNSTAVMNNIHGFINSGYDFAGLYEIQNKNKYVDNVVKGIRFKLTSEN